MDKERREHDAHYDAWHGYIYAVLGDSGRAVMPHPRGPCIWLFMRWLKHRKTLAMQYTPQRKNVYQDYQQGYQPQQPSPEIYEEG